MNQFAPPQKVNNKGREPSKTTHGNNTASRPINASIDHILHLQQTIGNQAVQRMIKSGALQLKGNRPQPGDIYTREVGRLMQRVEKNLSNPLPLETQEKAPIPQTDTQTGLTTVSCEHPLMSNVGTRYLTNTSKPIQRFTTKTYTINSAGVTGTLSENGKYFLPNGPIQSTSIYATSAPSYCTAVGSSTYSFNSKTYTLYKPGVKFLDDCLHSAEEIVNGKILAYGKGTYSKETTTKYVFGQSDTRNIEIAEAAKKASSGSVDQGADGGIGNAFVIVDTEFETKPSKRSPYHAAGIVGTDGNDRITMEVFASGGSTVKRETDAKLSMYTVGGGAKSFHGYWSGGYFSKYKTITIVIKAK